MQLVHLNNWILGLSECLSPPGGPWGQGIVSRQKLKQFSKVWEIESCFCFRQVNNAKENLKKQTGKRNSCRKCLVSLRLFCFCFYFWFVLFLSAEHKSHQRENIPIGLVYREACESLSWVVFHEAGLRPLWVVPLLGRWSWEVEGRHRKPARNQCSTKSPASVPASSLLPWVPVLAFLHKGLWCEQY